MKLTQEKPRALLIDLIRPDTKKYEAIERLEELEELMSTFGGLTVVKTLQRRNRPDYRTYIGKGKVETLKEMAKELELSVIVINNILKSQQIFNLNEALQDTKTVVWDRVDLILQIFDKHADTQEAKLQIELAKIKHMGPRIFGLGGAELSRQGGGTGTRGIGETNTEIMKRHLRERERTIKSKLDGTKNMREQQRKNRKRQGLKTISLAGYTNAGKTTLLNALTGRSEYVADKLFATLDTRTGSLYLPSSNATALVSDTIGFIRDLPPDLIQAFTSTLSETVHADILLHVVDASDARRKEHIRVVERILHDLETDQIPRIYVFNKSDQLKDGERERLETEFAETPHAVVSAVTGDGIPELVSLIESMLK